jgi:hypothetical protein
VADFLGFQADQEGEASDCKTGAIENNVIELPDLKRGRGRPKGSKNRVSKDARELIAQRGKGAIAALCRLAEGKAIFRLGPGGVRERLSPDLDQCLVAQRIVVDKLLPSLKTSEVASVTATFNGDDPNNPVSARDTAKAILTTLGSAVSAREVIETALERTAARGEAEQPHGADVEPREPPPTIGTTISVANNHATITLTEVLPDGRQRWAVHDCTGTLHCYQHGREAAEAWAVRKAAEGKLPVPRREDSK